MQQTSLRSVLILIPSILLVAMLGAGLVSMAPQPQSPEENYGFQAEILSLIGRTISHQLCTDQPIELQTQRLETALSPFKSDPQLAYLVITSRRNLIVAQIGHTPDQISPAATFLQEGQVQIFRDGSKEWLDFIVPLQSGMGESEDEPGSQAPVVGFMRIGLRDLPKAGLLEAWTLGGQSAKSRAFASLAGNLRLLLAAGCATGLFMIGYGLHAVTSRFAQSQLAHDSAANQQEQATIPVPPLFERRNPRRSPKPGEIKLEGRRKTDKSWTEVSESGRLVRKPQSGSAEQVDKGRL